MVREMVECRAVVEVMAESDARSLFARTPVSLERWRQAQWLGRGGDGRPVCWAEHKAGVTDGAQNALT